MLPTKVSGPRIHHWVIGFQKKIFSNCVALECARARHTLDKERKIIRVSSLSQDFSKAAVVHRRKSIGNVMETRNEAKASNPEPFRDKMLLQNSFNARPTLRISRSIWSAGLSARPLPNMYIAQRPRGCTEGKGPSLSMHPRHHFPGHAGCHASKSSKPRNHSSLPVLCRNQWRQLASLDLRGCLSWQRMPFAGEIQKLPNFLCVVTESISKFKDLFWDLRVCLEV